MPPGHLYISQPPGAAAIPDAGRQAGAHASSIDATALFASAMLFAWLFRPQLLHPLGSLALLPAAAGVICLLTNRALLERVFARLGPAFFILLAFLSAYALAADAMTGALGIIGARSQFFTTQRLVISLLGAIFIVAVLCRWQAGRFRMLFMLALGMQLIIGIAMLAAPEFKTFMYQSVSGYSGTEKLFEDYFFRTRIFGWSEELFFLAPVVMAFGALLFIPRLDPWRSMFLLAIVVLALLNARLALLGVLFGLLIGFRGHLLAPVLLLLAGLAAVASIGGPAVELVLADFEGGRSRTLDILLEGHIHFLLRGIEWLAGGYRYLHAGPNPPAFSDIGLIITLNYGGAIYLLAWLALVWCLVRRAFHSNWDRIMAYGLFLLVSIKGLAFSGNALVAFFIALALLDGYRGRAAFGPQRPQVASFTAWRGGT
jgi:hypothetical protein